MKILITGVAGFIGYSLCKDLLLNSENEIVGLDNINPYYDINLKFDRLQQLGIKRKDASLFKKTCNSTINNRFKFFRCSIEDKKDIETLFGSHKFDVVYNLAAQAGVRYSLSHPDTYIESNIVGFLNVLECCKNFRVKHLIFASSSSVYGLNEEIPFKVSQKTDRPISLYAATKKGNELMAHTYSHLYGLKTTGLRFFTVYGPWGRPDMAMFLFVDAILKNKPIKVFNNGEMERDFTFIDDIVDGLKLILDSNESKKPYNIYNIGYGRPIKLGKFIDLIEKKLNIKAEKEYLKLQPGDVVKTWSDTSQFTKDYGYQPKTNIEEGVNRFIEWYCDYYKE